MFVVILFLYMALVVQRIERRIADPVMQVRFPPRAQIKNRRDKRFFVSTVFYFYFVFVLII